MATNAAAEARLAAKTDTDRDAALAEARDQRVVNERLRAELEAATEAAAEARLAADDARDAAAKLAEERDAVWVSAGERSIADRDPIITVSRGDDASDSADRDRGRDRVLERPPRTLAARFG